MNTMTAAIIINPWFWMLISFAAGVILGVALNWSMTGSSKREQDYYLNIRRDADEHAMDYEKEVSEK